MLIRKLGLDHRFNTWVPREDLIQKGFTKIVQQFDDLESSREGAGTRDTSRNAVRKHLEDIGLDGDIAEYNEISGLSGGMPIDTAPGDLLIRSHRSKNQACYCRVFVE